MSLHFVRVGMFTFALTWAACGGGGDGTGGGNGNGNGETVVPEGVQVTITPSTADLAPGESFQFTATVSGTPNTAVTWQVQEETGGTIDDSNGFYIAPFNEGKFHVIATSQADQSVSDTATVNVTGQPAPFSTLLGGNGDEVGYEIWVNPAGEAYVSGKTFSEDFPTKNPLHTAGRQFVTKLDSSGTTLQLSTYLMGELAFPQLAVNSFGEIVIAGTPLTPDLVTTDGSTCPAGIACIYFAKLDPSGSQLVFATMWRYRFENLTGNFLLGDMVIDISDNITVGGRHDRGGNAGNPFIARFGGELTWATPAVPFRQLRDNWEHRDEKVQGLAIDRDHNLYVTGIGYGPTGQSAAVFGAGPGSFDDKFDGLDAFVMKFDRFGNQVFGTLLGGTSHDAGVDVAFDASGNAVVIGNTRSGDFPITSGGAQNTFGGLNQFGIGDVFITKINADGSDLVFSTFFGGTLGDSAAGIAIDVQGNVLFAGTTESDDLPVTSGAYDATYNGGAFQDQASHFRVPPRGGDMFAAKLTPDGRKLLYATYIGGEGLDTAGDVTLDIAGKLTMVGDTTSSDFPLSKDAFQQSRAGLADVVVFRLNSAGLLQ